MLRPATPLTILFLVSFACLLLSTISAPIVKSIPLGAFDDCTFGAFGYCQPGNCSSVSISYDTSVCSNGTGNGGYSFGAGPRHSLSSILIVHPIAAFFNLVCMGLAAAAHAHGPSHSPSYLLWLLILSFPTLLITLLAFLVDILLFVPHLQWGGWIVLASTIICLITSILICAMRRTLVSRKARKKRIAENAEMSGENYYNQQAQLQMVKDPPAVATSDRESTYIRADSPPPLNGETNDKLPQFATYDRQLRKDDDRQPLNASRDPSIKTESTGPPRSGGSGRRPPEMPTGAPLDRTRSGDGRVSPVSPLDYDGQAPGAAPPQNRYYNPGPPQQSRRGPPPPVYGRGGRGGYPPPRGGFQDRSAHPRGAYGAPPRGVPMPRGGYPPRGGYRGQPNVMRGPPPPQGYNHYGMTPMAAGAGAGVAAGAMMGRDYQNQYQPAHNNPYPPQDPYAPQGPYDDYPPTSTSTLPQQTYGAYNPPGSHPNLHAVIPPQQPQFHDGAVPYSGSASPRPRADTSSSSPNASEIRRDPSTLGFSGRRPSRSPARSSDGTPGPLEDVPPIPVPIVTRQDLPIGAAVEMDAVSGSPARSPPVGHSEFPNRNDSTSPYVVSPLNPPSSSAVSAFPLPEMPTQSSAAAHLAPVELPGHAVERPIEMQTRPRKSSEGQYYEDVDPRFAQDEPPLPPPSVSPGVAAAVNLPVLTPNGGLEPPRELGVARGDSNASSVYSTRRKQSGSERGGG